MSVADIGKFELFNLKDMWGGLKKNPWRALVGVDPLSTKLTNKVSGRHDEPLIDQMGGAYGGHTISAFGNKDGGVYGRAKDAGINTTAGGQMQDLAHVVAAFYGAQGLMGIGGAPGGAPASGAGPGWGGAGTSNSGLGVFGQSNLAGVGGGNAGALASSGGIEGGAGMGSATEAAPMGMQDYMKMGQSMQQQQQQPQQKSEPNRIRIWTDPQQQFVSPESQKVAALKQALLNYQRAA